MIKQNQSARLIDALTNRGRADQEMEGYHPGRVSLFGPGYMHTTVVGSTLARATAQDRAIVALQRSLRKGGSMQAKLRKR